MRQIFFTKIKVHCWGGLGSQLFAWAIAEQIKIKFPLKEIQIVLHTNGVTKRDPEISFLSQRFVLIYKNDYVPLRDQSEKKHTKKIKFKTLVKYLLNKTCIVIGSSEPNSLANVKPWTLELRDHYAHNIVPISKHYEICQTNYNNFEIGDINRFYNERAYIVYNMLERAGVRVDIDAYKRYHDKVIGEYAYTNYNLNTTTTRPSNTFGGINFSTLNKENGERECFIPRNDIFIEMDVSAFHPTLLSNILHHDFGGIDIHMAFAEMYGVDYQRSKEITFQQIYGGIWKQYEDLDFFKKVKQYTEEKWGEFNTQGYIECDISGYRFEKEKLGEMNPQKLLNYILQERETSTNVILMWDIFKVLRGLKTKLVLTVYDSYLLDLDIAEKDCILEIEKIFSKHNLTVKYKKGINYNFK